MTRYSCPVCGESYEWATMLACHMIVEDHAGEVIAGKP